MSFDVEDGIRAFKKKRKKRLFGYKNDDKKGQKLNFNLLKTAWLVLSVEHEALCLGFF